jgi:soluble lytic murein transglycosylase-like protein
MKRLIPALLLLASCSASPSPTPSTGTPRTEPEVLAMSEVRHDFSQTPATTTTTAPPPTTVAPTTTAAVVPVTAAPPARSTMSGVPAIIAGAFERFGSGVVDQAIRVAECESNLNPRAYNPSGASGLFQVMPLWSDAYQRVTGQPYYDGRFDARANATFAAWLYGQSGTWRHWSCKP